MTRRRQYLPGPFLSLMASYDAVSDICQALGVGFMDAYLSGNGQGVAGGGGIG